MCASKNKLDQFDRERRVLEEYLLTQGEDLRLGCPDDEEQFAEIFDCEEEENSYEQSERLCQQRHGTEK